MRRASVVGPLILILIGGLFLLNNLRPDLPLLEMMARYWPLLLVGWGVLRLLEILVLAARSKPLPCPGLTGGEWVLVVFITLAGTGLFWGRHFVSNWAPDRFRMHGIEVFGETYDFAIPPQQVSGKTARVVIENLRGNATVVGAEAEEVRVGGRKSIRAMSHGEAAKMDGQTPLEIARTGDQVVIRTNQERASGDRRVSADLQITVPRGATVEGRGRYGDFDISGVAGQVIVDSDNAGVRLQNIGGGVRLDLRRSDIARVVNAKGAVEIKSGHGEDVELDNIEGGVTVNGSFSGDLSFRNLAKPLHFESSRTDLRIEKVPGQARLGLGQLTGENLVGPIRLVTKTRDVRLTNFSQSLEISLERGDVDLQPGAGPAGKMQVETRSGDVELAIPSAARFVLNAATERGEVRNDYGEPLKVNDEGAAKGHGAKLAGAVGQGPEWKLTTGRGTVTVRKGSSAAGASSQAPPKPIKTEAQ